MSAQALPQDRQETAIFMRPKKPRRFRRQPMHKVKEVLVLGPLTFSRHEGLP
jgi:hypothetical protein